jgi:phytoene dehydrogenase-like protein
MHDLIVIGDDLSSHVAAALAARYGLDTVLVAERGTGGICVFEDFVFNIDPTPLSGFGVNQTCLKLLAELDIPLIEREGLPLNPAYQIILPEHRIDFFADKEALINEMIREFPQEAGEITAFYESAAKKSTIFSRWLHNHPYIRPRSLKDCFSYLKFMPHLIKHQVEMVKFKRILGRNASLNKIFDAQEALLFNTIGNQNNFPVNFQYCMPFRGIHYFRQGKQILFNSLIKKLEVQGGLYLSSCEISKINKGKAVEVEVLDKSANTSSISAEFLIASTKWKGMHLLLEGKNKINFGEWISPIHISHLPFTIHLGCARKGIPEKMTRHVAVVPDIAKNIFDNNLIILETSIPANETSTAEARVSLSATVFLPNDPALWSNDNLAIIATSIIERLDFFLPFLKDNIEFFDLEKSIDISRISHSVFNPKYRMLNSFLTGFAARSNKTWFKNVYLTGASLLTDAGFEGEIISGINAASTVIAKNAAGKRPLDKN